MDELSVFPNIVWKIPDVSGYCKRKSPYFSLYGARWKLKFSYTANINGVVAFQVVLKRSGDDSTNIDFLNVSSCCFRSGTCYFQKSVELTKLILNEWQVWEASFTVFTNTFSSQYTTISMDNFWEDSFFVCSITPTVWKPEIPEDINRSEVKSVDLSSCISSLCHDYRNLFNNHLMSDVILVCGDQKIYAHTAVLAARSDVFAAMFRNDMRESKERIVSINDVEPSILGLLVRYIYSGETKDLTPESVPQLYSAADKYGINALKMKCGILMAEPEVAATARQAAAVVDESSVGSLKESVISHFSNIKAVLSSEEWQNLSKVDPKFAHEAFLFFVSKSPS